MPETRIPHKNPDSAAFGNKEACCAGFLLAICCFTVLNSRLMHYAMQPLPTYVVSMLCVSVALCWAAEPQAGIVIDVSMPVLVLFDATR